MNRNREDTGSELAEKTRLCTGTGKGTNSTGAETDAYMVVCRLQQVRREPLQLPAVGHAFWREVKLARVELVPFLVRAPLGSCLLGTC